MLLNYSFLLPHPTAGILQLLTSRTSRKFLACRLTPDMETKLLFMTSRVSTQTLIPDTQTTIPLWLESQTLLLSLAAGTVWPAEALSGLVSAAVSVHSWEPVTTLWPYSLYMWCGSSIQWSVELWYFATLGDYWLAPDYMHGKQILKTLSNFYSKQGPRRSLN